MTAISAERVDARRVNALGVLRIVLVGVALLVVLLPFLWIAFNAFRSAADLGDPSSLAIHPTLSNWSDVRSQGVPAAALRSAIIGVITVAVAVVVGSMGAYAISRSRHRSAPMRFAILASTVLPPSVLVFPLLAIAVRLHLNDSLLIVVAAHLTFVVPIVTWFMVSFFDGVPRELEEQATIDGYGRFAAFRLVVLPSVLPGLGAAGLLAFMFSWNDLFYALILAPGNSRTLPVAIAGFNTFQGIKLGQMCAAILVAAVPVVILSFFIQRHLVRGMSGGVLKY
jgi:ABC-type glycerol-3-phosphate transport system permease component